MRLSLPVFSLRTLLALFASLALALGWLSQEMMLVRARAAALRSLAAESGFALTAERARGFMGPCPGLPSQPFLSRTMGDVWIVAIWLPHASPEELDVVRRAFPEAYMVGGSADSQPEWCVKYERDTGLHPITGYSVR